MQLFQHKSNISSYRKALLFAGCLFALGLLGWWLPFSQQYCYAVDTKIFLLLNQSLLYSTSWQQLCGWLSHSRETWLNLIVMLSINFLAIACLKKSMRKHAWLFVIYCWLFFQLGLLISHCIFSDLLAIERASPSLVISPVIKLSTLVGYRVKEYSESSFPAGHTFVLVYWAIFTNYYAPAKFKFLTAAIAIVLIMPRLISGAHWFSDVLFTALLAYMFVLSVIKLFSIALINQRLAEIIVPKIFPKT